MNREQTVEAVANVEREFNELVHGGVSDDSLVVLYRQLQNLRGNARHHGLGMTRIDALDEAIHQAMSEDAKERVANRPTHPAPRPLPANLNELPADQVHQFFDEKYQDRGAEECQDCIDGTCELPEHLDEDIFSSEPAAPPQPTEPPKSHDERRKEVTDLFGDLSL